MTRNPMSFDEAMAMFEERWEYAGTQPWIIDRVAWALYQTWKEADRRALITGEEDEITKRMDIPAETKQERNGGHGV